MLGDSCEGNTNLTRMPRATLQRQERPGPLSRLRQSSHSRQLRRQPPQTQQVRQSDRAVHLRPAGAHSCRTPNPEPNTTPTPNQHSTPNPEPNQYSPLTAGFFFALFAGQGPGPGLVPSLATELRIHRFPRNRIRSKSFERVRCEHPSDQSATGLCLRL